MASQSRPTDPAAGRRTIALWLEYDGQGTVGWQAQAGLPSIAGHLTAAIARVTGVEEAPQCAGRTDAGVHARAQLVAFSTASQVAARRFASALNHYLPPSIQVQRAWEAPPGFLPRYAALSKHYRYRILCAPHPSPLEAGRAWHLRRVLDLHAMRRAAAVLVGEHDFQAFRHAHCEAPHARREIFRLEVRARRRPPVGTLVVVDVRANALCRHMCRILVGTLAEAGGGRRPPASVATVLASRDRRRAGVTAPAQGLTLIGVRLRGSRRHRPRAATPPPAPAPPAGA